ncbi:MAG: LOG family protein [Armatimonadota bacterium]
MPENHRKPKKAYLDPDFLQSPDARVLRILAEYLGPLRKFRDEKVKDTIVFYGSARTPDPEQARKALERARRRLRQHPADEKLRQELERAEIGVQMSRYYDEARTLARMLTEWALARPGPWNRYLICSGGGPGIMEAANRGAAEAGGKTVGLTISLPFEEQGNSYITENLAMEFHYFFMRKYWFVYMARALVIFPGGFGTLDEMMDLLTLLQTRKIRRRLPVVMYGSEFWNEVLSLQALVKWGTISPQDLDLVHFCDDPQSAFDHLVAALEGKDRKPVPSRPAVG